MPIPSITILPSFGEILDIPERKTDQTLQVTTENVENTQSVSVALTSSPALGYTAQISDNSAAITLPAADLQSLTIGEPYQIVATIANIYGDSRVATYDFTVATPGGSVGAGGSIDIREEGVSVGFATVLDFVGGNITATALDEVATIRVIGEGGVGGGGTIYVRDENIPLGIVTTFNFTGLGVTATVSGQTAVVSIAGTIDGGGFND